MSRGGVVPALGWFFLLFAALTPVQGTGPRAPGEPKAAPTAIVLGLDGRARFTMLTEAMIRLEYSETREFEDRQTMVFWNRNLPVPRYSIRRGNNGQVDLRNAPGQRSYLLLYIVSYHIIQPMYYMMSYLYMMAGYDERS